MIKKHLPKLLITQLLLVSGVLIITTPSYAQDASSNQTYLQKITQMNNEARQQRFNNLKSQLISAAQGKSASVQQIQNASSMSDLLSPNTKTASCDCYSSSTANSNPNNFLYNANGQRTSRISPYCECQPTSTSGGTQENVTNPNENSSSNVKINY